MNSNILVVSGACGHCAEKPECRKQQCRKATVQKDTVQNGRNAEMGNVPIVLNSRVTKWDDVTTIIIN